MSAKGKGKASSKGKMPRLSGGGMAGGEGGYADLQQQQQHEQQQQQQQQQMMGDGGAGAAMAPPAPPSGGGGGKGGASANGAARDALYSFDEEKLDKIRAAKPWMKDPKYFKKAKVSPSAAMKMLMHANSGVEKGMKQGGKPVEIMGLMLGRPDTEDPTALVVCDVFPLPIEGAETKVLADDEEVTNYMIELGESLEESRKERFMGWYHSHPFDVEPYSHCFLSSTDVSTQLSWQRAEDPHGNPWLAIVVDPLRSLAKAVPEFGAFRVYPPEYASSIANEVPDGKIVTDDHARLERWGSCWNRYYTLEVEYFMSSMASDVMGILSENFLWMRMLSSTPMLEKENRERFAERVGNVSDKLDQFGIQLGHSGSHSAGRGGGGGVYSAYLMGGGAGDASGEGGGFGMGGGAGGGASGSGKTEENTLTKSTQSGGELAIELCQGHMTQAVKSMVFGCRCHEERKEAAAAARARAKGGEAPAPGAAAPALGGGGGGGGGGVTT